jgi:hypothetical protein
VRRRLLAFKATASRADTSSMSATATVVDYRVAPPEQELVTVRVGRDTKLHAMTRDGEGICAAMSLLRMFSSGDTEIIKVADGTDYVDCNACIWCLMKLSQHASAPEGRSPRRLPHRRLHRLRHLHAL